MNYLLIYLLNDVSNLELFISIAQLCQIRMYANRQGYRRATIFAILDKADSSWSLTNESVASMAIKVREGNRISPLR